MQQHLLVALAAATILVQAAPAVVERDNIVPKKAGLSGYPTIQNTQAFADLAPYIGWYSDYNPDTPDSKGVQGVPMLWGADGSSCDVTNGRLQTFKDKVANSTPRLMFGFFEPDCKCQSSSHMNIKETANAWNNLLVPLGNRGTILGSPSMCLQKDENYLTPFQTMIDRDWDITSIHVNKPDLKGIKADVAHYRKYGKPIFISEFACVFDQRDFTPCTDQGQIDGFINDAVEYFESQDDIVGYGPSNGEGLGSVWPLTRNGKLTKSGKTYLNAVKSL
uniref:Asl1-like glycosyl hydrolase catalytic domain-containing protein n=1 Tax=Ramularia collo-cygni TaxID=112498 RepID=A0A2D3UZS7_9PEZI